MDIVEKSKALKDEFEPLCDKIRIAGSLKRGKGTEANDIDLVLIPEDEEAKEEIKTYARTNGEVDSLGDKVINVELDGHHVDIYFTKPDRWGATLQMLTGSKNHNVFLRSVAKKKGLKLSRNGLFDRETDERIAGETEEEIYDKLGLNYKPPEGRNA